MAAILLGVCLLLGLWAFWIEPASVRIRSHEVELPGWPAECAGFRVAVLADLHVGSPFNGLSKLEEVVALTQVAEPDLILLAGDFVIQGVPGGRFEPPEAIAEALA